MTQSATLSKFISVLVLSTAIVYFALVIVYRSPSPIDMIRLITGTSVRLDSVVICRTSASMFTRDSMMEVQGYQFELSLYARNDVLPVLHIDSVRVIDRTTGDNLGSLPSTLMPKWGYRSYMTFGMSGHISNSLEDNGFRADDAIARAFIENSMEIQIYSGQGTIRSSATRYWTRLLVHKGFVR